MWKLLSPRDRLLRHLSDVLHETLPQIATSLSRLNDGLNILTATARTHTRAILDLHERCDELERRLDAWAANNQTADPLRDCAFDNCLTHSRTNTANFVSPSSSCTD